MGLRKIYPRNLLSSGFRSFDCSWAGNLGVLTGIHHDDCMLLRRLRRRRDLAIMRAGVQSNSRSTQLVDKIRVKCRSKNF